MAAYTDAFMIVGILILAAAFPAAVGAFSRGRSPRAAILALMVGGVLIVMANSSRPGGYKMEEFPSLFLSIFTG
ncbi:MAG: hypothetical protein GKR98_16075 [Boseongicola sp.]|nr:MAG: hypothetical protein GKR98_16075 [Boseongicola sp.]